MRTAFVMMEVVVGMGVKDLVCRVVICVPVLLFVMGTVMVIFPRWCLVVIFALLMMVIFPRW